MNSNCPLCGSILIYSDIQSAYRCWTFVHDNSFNIQVPEYRLYVKKVSELPYSIFPKFLIIEELFVINNFKIFRSNRGTEIFDLSGYSNGGSSTVVLETKIVLHFEKFSSEKNIKKLLLLA